MLFHVYDDPRPDGYYLHEPTGLYLTLLNADWLLYVLLPLLLAIVVVVLMLAWRLHEIPAHKAQHKKMRQAELVSALTLLGLFVHWVWVFALIIAFVNWDEVEEALVRILRRSREGPPTPAPSPANVPASEAVGAASTPTVPEVEA